MSDARRRSILRLLRDRRSPIEVRELATHLIAEEQEKPLVDVGPFEVETVGPALAHRHLPKLEEAGLIHWNRESETVTTTDHPALSDPKLGRMIDVDAADWDTVLANLARKRRRIILSALKDHEDPIPRVALANEVIARERDDGEHKPTDAADDLLAELHHVHLPNLQQAGLVMYDTEIDTVAYRGHPALEDEWLDFRRDETPRAILPAA